MFCVIVALLSLQKGDTTRYVEIELSSGRELLNFIVNT